MYFIKVFHHSIFSYKNEILIYDDVSTLGFMRNCGEITHTCKTVSQIGRHVKFFLGGLWVLELVPFWASYQFSPIKKLFNSQNNVYLIKHQFLKNENISCRSSPMQQNYQVMYMGFHVILSEHFRYPWASSIKMFLSTS